MTDFSDSHLKDMYYDYYIYEGANLSQYFSGNFSLDDLMSERLDRGIIHHQIWPYLFWITFTMGITGNGVFITVYCRSRQMKTVTNTYLFNLSVVDIAYLFSTLSYNTTWIQAWPLGEFMCKFLGYLMHVTTTLGILTLTAIGVDRHNAVIYPVSSRSHRTIPKTVVVIVAIWLFSCAVSPPSFIIAKHIEVLGHDVCMHFWWEKWMHQVYASTTFALFYVFPQLVLFVCYCRIGYKLWFSVQANGQSSGMALRKLRKGRRVVKMAAIVTVSFVICWLPLHVMELLVAFKTEFSTGFHDMKVLAPLVPHFCIAANPFVYNFMSKTFQKHLKETVKCLTYLFRAPVTHTRNGSTVEENMELFPTFTLKGMNNRLAESMPVLPRHALGMGTPDGAALHVPRNLTVVSLTTEVTNV